MSSHSHDFTYIVKTDEEEKHFVGLVEQIPAIIVGGNSIDEVDASIREVTERYVNSLPIKEHTALLAQTGSLLPDTSAGKTVLTRQFRVYC